MRNRTRFLPLVLFAAAMGFALAFLRLEGPAATRLLAMEWLFLIGLFVWLSILPAYEAFHPGVRVVAMVMGVVTLPWLGIEVLFLGRGGQVDIAVAVLHFSELIVLALALSWIVVLMLATCMFLAGLVGARQLGALQTDSNPLRSIFTALVSLVVPAGIWYLTILILMGGMLYATRKEWIAFPTGTINGWLHPGWHGIPLDAFFLKLVEHISGPWPTAIGLFWLVALLLLGWGFSVAIGAENRRHDADPVQTERLGRWLDMAYWSTISPTLLIALAIPIVLSVGLAFQMFSSLAGQQPPQVAGLFVLLIIAYRLKLVGGLGPMLDVILDVDNHLRVLPADRTPRARIAARYASLLRYIADRRDEAGAPFYSSVVFVAHSQGTVVTADLLRFLHGTDHDLMDRLQQGGMRPLRMLTFGCPLRQLYSWRFPDLYGWARHSNQTPQQNAQNHVIDDADRPLPDELGLDRWVNVFRSGDYIGRHLWRHEAFSFCWKPGFSSESFSKDRRELCLGRGAHTHYLAKDLNWITRELVALL